MELKKTDTLTCIYNKLMEHLYKWSSVSFNHGGIVEIYIPDNGHFEWWFDDLIKVILLKAGYSEGYISEFIKKNDTN